MEPHLTSEFDPDLWEGGVESGAFAGDRDPDSSWYTLKVGEEKVALASAVPGPGELTTISYYVHPDYRGNGYGTKIASRVTDLHDKATFTIFKDNEASIKVAMNALRQKFSMTLGHNVVRLTKEAASQRSALLLTRSRQLSRKGKMPSGYRVEEAAKALGKVSPEPVPYSKAKSLIRLGGPRTDRDLELKIRNAIVARISPQKKLF